MYPVPLQPPVYEPSPKVSGNHYSRSRTGRLIEQLFFLAALGLSFVLAYYLLTSAPDWGWWADDRWTGWPLAPTTAASA